MALNVHLEIHVVNRETGQKTNVWRRTIHNFEGMPVAMQFMLYSKDRAQKWLFPSGGDPATTSSGDHYDMHLEAYVIWYQTVQNLDYEYFGFSQLVPERWV